MTNLYRETISLCEPEWKSIAQNHIGHRVFESTSAIPNLLDFIFALPDYHPNIDVYLPEEWGVVALFSYNEKRSIIIGYTEAGRCAILAVEYTFPEDSLVPDHETEFATEDEDPVVLLDKIKLVIDWLSENQDTLNLNEK